MLYLSEWFLILAIYPSGVALLLILLRLTRRQGREAVDLFLALATFWLGYLLLGGIVAILTPQRVLRAGQPQFFDEMGVTVTAVEHKPILLTDAGSLRARGMFYVLTARVFNRSAKVPHRAPPLAMFLQDAVGNLYGPSPAATALLQKFSPPKADALFAPGEGRTFQLAFDVPPAAERPSFIIRHRNPYALNRILLGDPEHFWHRSIVVLPDR